MSLPSHWLSLINEAEDAAKHQDSLRFFELGFQYCCEDVQLFRDELKSYATRHNLLDDDYLGVGVYSKTVKKLFRRYDRPEPSPTEVDLPFEMQMEIIKRLPIKPLIRFRSVSKPWKNLIDSSKFIKDYNSTRPQKHHLLVKYRDAYKYVPEFVSIVDYDDSFPQLKFSLTAPEFAKLRDSTEIVGSSQGLMCLYNYYDRFYGVKNVVLWNPSIRKSVAIDVAHPLDSSYRTVIGFGVSPHTNDPKLVKINYIKHHSQDDDTISCIPWQVEVFSLSSGVWRSPLSTNLPRRSIRFTKSQVVIDEFIYWLAFDPYVPDQLIMSFDMTTEEFTEIYLPDSLKRKTGIALSISKLNESLVVLESISHVFEVSFVGCNVWIMEHGVPKTFTKLYTINTPATPIRKVLGFTNSGKLIMVKASFQGPVFAYEPCSKRITNIGISGNPMTFFASSFVESLLLLDHRD